MKIETTEIEGRPGAFKVTIELIYDPAKEYPLSGSGNSHMVDGSKGFQQVQADDVPDGLKVDCKLILVIPKARRGK